jgi:hypothetical protein
LCFSEIDKTKEEVVSIFTKLVNETAERVRIADLEKEKEREAKVRTDKTLPHHNHIQK